MRRCDVIIVGGGPAGASLAWALRRGGMDVAIVDKKAFPRNKVCAGWITPAIVEELKLDLEDYAEGRVLQPITGFVTGLIGAGEDAHNSYERPVSYGIRRCEFDTYLLRRSGAHLYEETPFKSLRREGTSWRVNEALEAPLVVGAGGHFCPVARALGNTLGRSETVVAAQEIEIPMDASLRRDCSVRGDTPELFFCADLKGYAWCFRKGDWLNVGLGREDNQHLAAHVQAFCDFLHRRGKVPGLHQRFNGHAYLLYTSGRRAFVSDGALLIGDAAGLAYAQSGEGIRPAVESALMAAQVIKAAGGDYTRERLAEYESRLTRRFGSRDPGGLERMLPGWVKQAAGRRLIANRWLSRKVVLDRWFLHADQPPLAV